MDLRLAFLLYVALPLLVLVAAAGSLSLGVLEEINEKRLQEELELIGRTLEKPMGRALEQDRHGTLENALASAFNFGRVYGAYLYNADGELLASAGATQPDSQASPAMLEKANREGEAGGEYGYLGGREVYSFFIPLTNSTQQMNGLLQITRRKSEIEAYTQDLRLYGAAGLGALTLVLITITFLGYQRAIAAPLSRLTASMRQVAGGDLDHRTQPTGPREVEQLARTFNAMLERMQQDREEIQERRRSQERLQQELHQAEKMASIGRLSAGVAHELGTPLSVVDGSAQRLLRRSELSAETHGELWRIREQAQRMTQIVEQLLAFGSHPEGSPRPVLVGRLSRAVARNAREALETAGTELQLELPEANLYVHLDPFRGEQMLSHLVNNAIQAAPGGTVRIAWEALANGRVRLTVADSGAGVPADLAPHVFEPFFTTKPPGQGSGLGLAMVHGVVEEHAGRIEIGTSELGGAAFHVELPRAEGTGAEEGSTA